MSPEYRVDIAIPYVFFVEADNPEAAEEKALAELRQSLEPENRQGAPNSYDLPPIPISEAIVYRVEETSPSISDDNRSGDTK